MKLTEDQKRRARANLRRQAVLVAVRLAQLAQDAARLARNLTA